MPGLPWTTVSAPDSDRPCTVLAVHAAVRRDADQAPLSVWVRRLEPVLAESRNLLGYGYQLTSHDLIVVSAWTHRASMAAFDRSDLHTQAKAELRPLLHPAVLAVWTTSTAQLPPDEGQLRQRLAVAAQRTRPPHTASE